MADIGLQAVDGQDHAARGRRHPTEASGVGEREGQQLVIAVQQVGDAPDADRHAASGQLGVDLRDAPMPGMAEDGRSGR